MATMSTLGFDNPRTQSAMRGANPENFHVIVSGHAMREPRRMIYVHSVSRRSFGPIRKALFPGLTLRGCEPGERYVTCCSIPDPIAQARPDQESGGTRIDEHDGWRAAIDMLNTANLSSDPFQGDTNPDFYANRSGMNLIAEGFWPSVHQTPPDAEIRAAESRRDRHYLYLTREATRLAAKSTVELNEFLRSYPDTHIAMDALGLQAPWHQLNEIKATCPNCGDSVKQGIAFHQSSAGTVCIIDPQRAYRAGAITKEKCEELTEEPARKRGPGRPPRQAE